MNRVGTLPASDQDFIRGDLRPRIGSECGCEICRQTSAGPGAVAMPEKLRQQNVAFTMGIPDLVGSVGTRKIERAPPTAGLIRSLGRSKEIVRQILAVGAVRGRSKPVQPKVLADALGTLVGAAQRDSGSKNFALGL